MSAMNIFANAGSAPPAGSILERACGRATRSRLGSVLLLSSISILPTGAFQCFASPVGVNYTTTNLGGSKFSYSYRLSGILAAGDDVAIYFPLATSSGLMDLGTGGPNFTTFVFQPDPGIPADGEFDILANIANPSLTPTFSVDFLYSGSGMPGAQSFTVFDSNFNAVQSGVTVTPEPPSVALLLTGCAALLELQRRRRRTVRPPGEADLLLLR